MTEDAYRGTGGLRPDEPASESEKEREDDGDYQLDDGVEKDRHPYEGDVYVAVLLRDLREGMDLARLLDEGLDDADPGEVFLGEGP